MNLKELVKIGSTIGTSTIGYNLATYMMGNDIASQVVGALAFGAVGYSVVYIAIPRLLKEKMFSVAFVFGLGMSLTWVLNADSILDRYKKNLCIKIDPKFNTYYNDYKNSKAKTAYTSDTLGALQAKAKTLILSINALEDKAGLRRSTRNLVDVELSQKKVDAGKGWKNVYPSIAKRNGCRARISYNALVDCVSKRRFDTKMATEIQPQLDSKKEELLKVKE